VGLLLIEDFVKLGLKAKNEATNLNLLEKVRRRKK